MGRTFSCGNTNTAQHQCKVITVASRKGGVGKTTTTVSLCTGLASQSKDDGTPIRVFGKS